MGASRRRVKGIERRRELKARTQAGLFEEPMLERWRAVNRLLHAHDGAGGEVFRLTVQSHGCTEMSRTVHRWMGGGARPGRGRSRADRARCTGTGQRMLIRYQFDTASVWLPCSETGCWTSTRWARTLGQTKM